MMEEIEKFWQNIREAMKGLNTTVIPGTVSSVNEKERTCSIKHGGVEFEDARLYSIVKGDLKGFCFIPKVGSHVLAARIDGSNELFITMFSEIDKILFTLADMVIQVDKDACLTRAKDSTLKITPAGITVTRGSSGLKKTLNDLLTALQELTVPTGVGPSGMPINVADFVKIQQDLNNYLEG